MSRSIPVLLVLPALLAPTSGCLLFFDPYETAHIEAEDVRLDPPNEVSSRAAGERGEIHDMSLATAKDVNGWVSEVVHNVATLNNALNQFPENGTVDDFRVYGPYDDEDGGDERWIIKLAGDLESSRFEYLVGTPADTHIDDFDVFIAGNIDVADDLRSGEFSIDFDTMEKHPDVKDEEDQDEHYGGVIEVAFSRDIETEHKYIDLDFHDFFVENEAENESLDFTDEAYSYQREADGSGRFHLGVHASFEDEEWSGPAIERMALDLRWDVNEAGRARGMITGVDGEGGDMLHGDLVVHECFDPGGSLTYRAITEAYAEEGYDLGDEETCIFTEQELSPS